MRRHSFPDVREGRTPADARHLALAQRQNRHLLTSVIGSAPGWIAPVIGSNDEQIVHFQTLAKLGQAAIELLQRKRVTGGVAAMAVDRIEVDEVCEQEPAVSQT